MEIGVIENHTRVIGKSQGYLGLPLRDVVVNCTVSGEVPAMQTAWLPNPRELELIAAGAPIILTILGVQHPPVLVDVGAAPDAT